MSRRKLQWRQRLFQLGQSYKSKSDVGRSIPDRAYRDQRLPTDVQAAVSVLAPEGMKHTSMERVVRQFTVTLTPRRV